MNPLQTAAVAHFEAMRTRALANLQVCLSSPVGVGSHTDIVDDVVNLINEIANAEAGLEILSRVVEDDPTGSEEE
jgi:methylaspartate ammonia-lyase